MKCLFDPGDVQPECIAIICTFKRCRNRSDYNISFTAQTLDNTSVKAGFFNKIVA